MSTLCNRTKAKPQRSGMTHAKWREVQNIHRKSAARIAHESVKIVPVSELFPRGLMLTGDTLNQGRNKAKREKRAAAAAARFASRSH